MKTKFWKTFLSVIILCGVLLQSEVVFASENSVNNTNSAIVVNMKIVSVPGNISIQSSSTNPFGHAFLVFENKSTIPVTIGHMTIPVNDYITLGIFNNRSSHVGIWYNVEGFNLPAIYFAGCGIHSYNIQSSSQVATVNAVIGSSDYYVQSTHNCCHFAEDVWNSVTPSDMHVYGIMPLTLKNSILSHGGSTTIPLPPNAKSIYSIAYHTSTGYVFDTSGAYAN